LPPKSSKVVRDLGSLKDVFVLHDDLAQAIQGLRDVVRVVHPSILTTMAMRFIRSDRAQLSRYPVVGV